MLQALMNSIFTDLIAPGKVAVYLDDILIFTETIEEHRALVHEVCTWLAWHDLHLQPKKCKFEQSYIEYLGLVISEWEVRMNPVKGEAVKDWPAPTSLRDFQGFLSFANFYWRFIEGFAKKVGPLIDLTWMDIKWN